MSTAISYVPVSPTRLHQLFEGQRATALRLRTSTAQERIAKLKKLRAAFVAAEPAWFEAMYADFRKPKEEVEAAEMLPAVLELNDAIASVKRWMEPEPVRATLPLMGTSSFIQYQPRGRCLLMSPWNYPLLLTVGPLISAIAAGNTVIIKPSELTPHTSAALSRLIREVFTEDEVALVEGDATTAQALLELPFDHIFFTGSPAVGKLVMAAAAKNLTSVTLELGGKSPCIVDETANLGDAAANIMWSKFLNDGQTCIAPDHLFVHASVKDEFVSKCRAVLETRFGSEAQRLDSPYLARLVNPRHTARVKGLLDDALAKGAKVVVGGTVNEAERYVAPTLLENVPADAAIMQEEIFGPLLPIITFTSADEVVHQVDAGPKPLALYVWSRDEAFIDRIMSRTTSGGACINHTVVQVAHGRLPFGGVNNSGIGNAHGHYGFKAFSHERGVVRDYASVFSPFYPPYRAGFSKLLKLIMRLA